MNEYTLDQLSQHSGMPGRRIRYYIAEKLLPGSVTQGRNAIYTETHLQRLRDITRLRKEGHTLQVIRSILTRQSSKGGNTPPRTPTRPAIYKVWEE